ncbi:hypothetical protein DWY84_01380 [Clostridium sp. AF27-2AA]|uniref:hypothetical protein n=1 Tax=Clostridium sp. AF27-2AA TaxID=2292206 RepID=UPI000E52B43A|nr:hypothetical protein [Clostridium sp. AF27-2AA]RHQ36270.1 hypothetical protein DWY84_01380 [Clostridium sp. AF27-2AA]
MDKLVEFLTARIFYTVAIIGGLLFPGLIFVFVWDRDFFSSISFLLLLVFSTAVSFMVYIANVLFMSYVMMFEDKMNSEKEPSDIHDLLGIPLIFSVIEMSVAMIAKLYNKNISIFICVIILLIALISFTISKCIYLKVKSGMNNRKK